MSEFEVILEKEQEKDEVEGGKTKKVIHIIYASETGNSEDIAFSLSRRIEATDQNLLDCFVHNANNLHSYDFLLERKDTLKDSIYVFLLSTTGDGDAPQSFKTFWQSFLKKGLPATLLAGCSFAVFGFGDSSYEKYNVCARKFFVRMKQLGASPVTELGLGDDQASLGYHQSLERFLTELTVCLQKNGFQFTLRKNPSFAVNYEVVEVKEEERNEVNQSQSLACSDPDAIACQVVFNHRLSASDWYQDIRWLRLEGITGSREISYDSGDVAVIYYRNSEDLVNRALQYFMSRTNPHWLPTTRLSISYSNHNRHRNPSLLSDLTNVTLRELFESWLEIGGIPKPSFFALLAHYSSIEEEREKLLELSSKEGTDLYYSYCYRERRTYLDLLEEFPGLSLPLTALLEGCPRLVPRRYSLASYPSSIASISSGCGRNQLDLCVAVAEYTTPLRKKRYGLCSRYLSELQPSQICYLRIERGMINDTMIKKHWMSSHKPLICIGPGTGIAPIRSLAHHLFTNNNTNKSSNELVVFFGCRKPDKDHLFHSEWQETSRLYPNNLKYFTAYSQQQLVKQYVTHALRDHSQLVISLLDQGGGVFISGSAKRMPADVKRVLIEIIAKEKQVSEAEATQRINAMIARKEYVVDAW